MTTTTTTTPIEYTDALAREWIEAAGQAADFLTIDRAEEALAGDAEAQADVVAWEIEARANRADA